STDETSCLFATMGFWQGVDVPGAALSLLVIDKLPFSRPDEPLMRARRDRAGAAAFRIIDLPRAPSLLAQGAGLLLRPTLHRAGAYRLALLLTGNNAPLAEDIVSDAFVAVYPRWRDGKVEHFEPYLLRTVANRVKGSFRRLAVERRHASDSVAEVVAGPEPSEL